MQWTHIGLLPGEVLLGKRPFDMLPCAGDCSVGVGVGEATCAGDVTGPAGELADGDDSPAVTPAYTYTAEHSK